MAKRLFDFLISVAGLVVLSPGIALLAILIKLDSRGPAFYRGVRAGRYGRPFRIFKLRTMVINADQLGGAETPADDPRITRIGSFLRHYKLDEFPQLLNVMLGDMSLVGPRPEVMEEVDNYDDRERQLLRVRPGITDRASIKFRHEGEILRGSRDPHRTYHEIIRPEKIRLGLRYVENHSLVEDFRIMFQTLIIIFQ